MFDILEADIVVFQETKIQRKDLKDDMVLVPGWDCYFSLPKHKKGRYCQLAVLATEKLIREDTPASLSTLVKQSVVPSEPKKASPVFYAHQIPRRAIPIYQKTNRLVAILQRPK